MNISNKDPFSLVLYVNTFLFVDYKTITGKSRAAGRSAR